MVVNGSLSTTAVNASAGARTQLSELVDAVLTVVTLLFLTALFENLPEATLAAVVIAALIELVDVAALARLYRLYTRRLGRIYGHAARPDFVAAVATMFGVLIFDTLPGRRPRPLRGHARRRRGIGQVRDLIDLEAEPAPQTRRSHGRNSTADASSTGPEAEATVRMFRSVQEAVAALAPGDGRSG